MRTKKILCILHLPPPVHGAAMVGQWIKDSEFINKDLDITYINLSTSQTLQEIGVGGFKKMVSFLKVFLRVLMSLLSKKYDLCYMTITAKGPGFHKDACIVFLLKLFNQNILYHFHNKGVRKNIQTSFKKKLYQCVFKKTKSILLSKYLYSDVSPFVAKKNVYYCANGINDVDYNFSVSQEKQYEEQQVCKFLFLSNMMKEKGVFILLEACKILKEKEIPFECHFIGAWSDITENYFWNKVDELLIRDCVFAHGKKYNEEKFEFFKNSDLFVFPTFYHNEAFPLVLIEAMQANLPVISTYEGGIPEMIINDETGFLIPQKNVTELADKLEILCKNPDLRIRMGKAGNQLYKEKFTMDIFEHNICKIFHDA